MARIKFSGTGFTPIPNQLIDLWPLLRRLRIPVVIDGKKVDAQLVPVDRVILEVLFRMAYAGRMSVSFGQRKIAALADIKERQLRYRLQALEAAGMLAIARHPGKESVLDLDVLVEFLRRFQAPALPPVEKSPDLSTTPAMECRSTPAMECRGQEADFALWNSREDEEERGDGAGEGGADPGDNKQSLSEEDLVESRSERWNSRETLREFPHPPSQKPSERPGPPAIDPPPSTPPDNCNGSERGELRLPELSEVLEDPRIPEAVRTRRKHVLEEQFPPEMRRQAIETIIRTELRLAGIKSSLINRYFAEVPLDGMLWWISQAYAKASRNPGGFIATTLKRTGGAIPADLHRGDGPNQKEETA
jgi:hypothetical protein